MPDADKYDRIYRDPSFGMAYKTLLACWESFNIKSPYETIEIPTAWLIDPRLSNREKIVLLVMNAYANKEGVVTISKRQLQIYTHGDRTGMIRAIKTLKKLGYIERIDAINGKRPKYRMIDPTPPLEKLSEPKKKEKTKSKTKKQS
jgi:hypothetical protein